MACSKRGQLAAELLFLVIFLMAMGLTLILSHKTQTDINTEIQADPTMNAEAKASMQTVTTNYPSTWDNGMVILIVLFWVFLLVSAYYIDTHPVFFIINLVIIIILLSVVIIIANAYTDVTGDADLATYAADFPKLAFLMSHIIILITVMALSTGVVLYAKN